MHTPCGAWQSHAATALGAPGLLSPNPRPFGCVRGHMPLKPFVACTTTGRRGTIAQAVNPDTRGQAPSPHEYGLGQVWGGNGCSVRGGLLASSERASPQHQGSWGVMPTFLGVRWQQAPSCRHVQLRLPPCMHAAGWSKDWQAAALQPRAQPARRSDAWPSDHRTGGGAFQPRMQHSHPPNPGRPAQHKAQIHAWVRQSAPRRGFDWAGMGAEGHRVRNLPP